MVTVPMAYPCPLPFRHLDFHSLIADLFMQSRIFVVAKTRVMAGISMASGKRRQTRFRISSHAQNHLVAEKIVSSEKIVAHGGSAGGMLMGAVTNMAPEKFLGIVAEVPFVDVLNTMLDDTLPLTPPEWPEWGNPIASKEDFDNIRSYSPYDNIEAKDYTKYFRYWRIDGPSRHLLGTCKMGCTIARVKDGRQNASIENQYGRRPWRRSRQI